MTDQHCMAVPATTRSRDLGIRGGSRGIGRNSNVSVSLCADDIDASAGCVLFWFSHSPESNAVIASATVDIDCSWCVDM